MDAAPIVAFMIWRVSYTHIVTTAERMIIMEVMTMSNDLNKWSKNLLKGINAAFAESAARQRIFNEFLCEKLSDEDQSLLVGKLIAHDNQTKADRFEAEMAKFEKTKEIFKEVKK
jgi:hypothetical protein